MMQTKQINELLVGEITSNNITDDIFNKLENDLLDRKEITLDFSKVIFISVYFLERLENFVNRAKDLNVKIQILNTQPSIYKVFQVARSKTVLEVCS